MRALMSLTALAMILLAAPASAFTPDRAALMVDAVRANGCTMEGEAAEGTLAPLGLDGVEVQAFVDTLFGAGLVSLSDDLNTLTLSDDLCAAEGAASLALITAAFEAQESAIQAWRPDFTPERGAVFIAVVRAADCTLTEEAAQDLLPEQNFTPAETRDIVTVLVTSGVAEVAEDGSALSIATELCSADPAGDAEIVALALQAWADANPPADAAGEASE